MAKPQNLKEQKSLGISIDFERNMSEVGGKTHKKKKKKTHKKHINVSIGGVITNLVYRHGRRLDPALECAGPHCAPDRFRPYGEQCSSSRDEQSCRQ